MFLACGYIRLIQQHLPKICKHGISVCEELPDTKEFDQVALMKSRFHVTVDNSTPEYYAQHAYSDLMNLATQIGNNNVAYLRDIIGCILHIYNHKNGSGRLELKRINEEILTHVTIQEEWRTDSVLAIAQSIYNERKFDDMGILGDALQESGCNNETIIQHCQRDHHLRGCWLIDSLIGKDEK